MADRMERLLKLWESDPGGDADVPYMIAQEHAQRDEHAEALAWYDRALEADPSYHYAQFHKARSLEALERTPEAVAALRAGLDAATADRDEKAADDLASYLDSLQA